MLLAKYFLRSSKLDTQVDQTLYQLPVVINQWLIILSSWQSIQSIKCDLVTVALFMLTKANSPIFPVGKTFVELFNIYYKLIT